MLDYDQRLRRGTEDLILNSLQVRRAVSRLPRGGMRLTKLLCSVTPQKREFRLTSRADVRMLLDTSDTFQAQMAFGTYQKKLLTAIERLASPKDRVLVAGSHVGYVPLSLAIMGCEVFAFEADPRNVKQSLHNIGLNQHLPVKFAGVGLSDTESAMPIWLSETSSNSSLAFAHLADTKAMVTVRPGDDVLREFGVTELDGLLLDVEGWEVKALSGLRRTLQKRLPRWAVIECAAWALEGAGSSASELRDTIDQIGWTKVERIGDDLICS